MTRSTDKAWRVACLLFAGFTASLPVIADHAEIRDARTLLVDGVYRVGANVVFDMDEKVQAALDNGVPLVVRVNIKVIRQHNRFWKTTESVVNKRYRIQYHALSQRYIVKNLKKNTQTSFRFISDVLEAIGTVYDVPVIRDSQVQGRKDYRVRMQVSFDVESLPTPIRLWAYFGSDWKLTGGWHEWPLHP
ncbi:MAG: DUF4390 domain-containing protein [Gammaproteobacteria bacterium]